MCAKSVHNVKSLEKKKGKVQSMEKPHWKSGVGEKKKQGDRQVYSKLREDGFLVRRGKYHLGKEWWLYAERKISEP